MCFEVNWGEWTRCYLCSHSHCLCRDCCFHHSTAELLNPLGMAPAQPHSSGNGNFSCSLTAPLPWAAPQALPSCRKGESGSRTTLPQQREAERDKQGHFRVWDLQQTQFVQSFWGECTLKSLSVCWSSAVSTHLPRVDGGVQRDAAALAT